MPSIDELDALRYTRMRWNTPLSEAHAALLLDRLQTPPGARVLDLGCGWGELLLHAVEDTGAPATNGTGVDVDDEALERGRAAAATRSLDKQVKFVSKDASDWSKRADRVICVGASHAFGGPISALTALSELVRPGGRLLFGEEFWERPPSAEAKELLGSEIMTLDKLVEQVRALGWRVLHLSTADQREWDDFESTWLAALQEWLVQNPKDSRASDVREELDDRLREYIGVYRGVLGLAYLVVAR